MKTYSISNRIFLHV